MFDTTDAPSAGALESWVLSRGAWVMLLGSWEGTGLAAFGTLEGGAASCATAGAALRRNGLVMESAAAPRVVAPKR